MAIDSTQDFGRVARNRAIDDSDVAANSRTNSSSTNCRGIVVANGGVCDGKCIFRIVNSSADSALPVITLSTICRVSKFTMPPPYSPTLFDTVLLTMAETPEVTTPPPAFSAAFPVIILPVSKVIEA